MFFYEECVLIAERLNSIKTQNKGGEKENMLLTAEIIIKDKTGILTNIAKEANNLYNATLFQVRQAYFKRHLLNYNQLDKLFKEKARLKENMLYRKLGYTQTAQQTLKEVNTIFYSWIKAKKEFYKHPNKFTGKPKIPHYLRKGSKHIFYVTNQSAKVKDNCLFIPKLKLKIKLDDLKLGKIKRIAFSPLNKKRFRVLIQHEVKDVSLKPDNGNYVGIDYGVNNAFTCVTNTNHQPLIINGRGLKSVNQFYNKKRSSVRQQLSNYNQCQRIIRSRNETRLVGYDSNRLISLTQWRNTKVKQFAHKATKRIIEYTLNCDANTIVIGHNKQIKQKAKMGKRNNQNFINIPHAKMIAMLKYKAALNGIKVIEVDESYTSQTSFLDGELPIKANGNKTRKEKQISPINRRIKRGLFKTNTGKLINADVNGALQIIKKAFPNFKLNDGIEGVVLRPVKWSPVF